MVSVTIVNYHYVRSLERSRYPHIKALATDAFEDQLSYFQRRYTIIRMEELMEAIRTPEAALPDNALLLTFDDGYIDHFTTVFPILFTRGIQGSFFPPVQAVRDRRVLDVNKIHFTLAAAADEARLVEDLFKMLDSYRQEWRLESNDHYYRTFAVSDRFDSAQVIFVKRLLQKGLPDGVRERIVDSLFKRYVSQDEAAFAETLYLTAAQLQCMRAAGMFIGSHGYKHCWLNSLTPAAQETEVDRSLEYLSEIGVIDSKAWVMSYPYGGYDQTLLQTVERKGCAVGLTVHSAVADLGRCSRLELPRFDTNDFPRNGQARSA